MRTIHEVQIGWILMAITTVLALVTLHTALFPFAVASCFVSGYTNSNMMSRGEDASDVVAALSIGSLAVSVLLALAVIAF